MAAAPTEYGYTPGVAQAGGSASSTLNIDDGSASNLQVYTYAYGGTGGSTDTGTSAAGGAATAVTDVNSTAATGGVSGYATAYGGNSGSSNAGYYTAAGGAASATANVSANGGYGAASASATGGYGATGPGAATAHASVSNASSGYAAASSVAQGLSGSVHTEANAAVGGGASASTVASIGAGGGAIIPIVAGQSAAEATLTPAGPTIAVGAFSAGYGGSGEAVSYAGYAYLDFTTTAPETLYLDLLGNNGGGFDNLALSIYSSAGSKSYDFTSLASAQAFFDNTSQGLGNVLAGSQYVDLYFSLTASGTETGFGFNYNIAEAPYFPPAGAPEASTWAMMLTGFAGFGFAGFRRGQRAKARFAA